MVRVGGVEDVGWVVGVAREVVEAPQWGEEDYRRVLEGGSGAVRRRVFVWERVGFAVGMVLESGAWCEGEVENVVVVERARRKGIGRALCGAVVGWCFAEGSSLVRLEVRASNEGAIGLYGGLGFRETGVRKGYYRGPVEDALEMEMDQPHVRR